MATFKYVAKNSVGKIIKDVVEAQDQNQALKILKRNELIVLELGQKRSLRLPTLRHKVSLFDKMNFTKQLAVMVKAGMPIYESLKMQSEQSTNPYFATIINDVGQSISGGATLGKALEKHRAIFSDVYIAMVSAGEKSGQLEKVLARLGDSLERERDLIGKIKGAFYYPAFIFVVLVAITIFVLIFVIPQLRNIFDEAGAELPFLTRALLGISDLFVNHFPFIIIGTVILIVIIRFSVKINAVKKLWHRVQLKIPLFGKFYQKIYLERFARTLASMIAAGIPILEVMSTTAKVVTNSLYQKDLEEIKNMVEHGQPISQSIAQYRRFPPIISNFLSIGEKTGNLAPVSEDLAEYYSKEIDQTAKNFSSLLEPFIMLVMGVGIGLVVLAVVMPIYRLIGIQ